MIALDTNVIIYSLVSSSSFHKKTISQIKKLDDLFCTTQTNIGELLRILTHPQIFKKSLSISKAVQLLSNFFNAYNVVLLDEPDNWWNELPHLDKQFSGIRGNGIFDARIAVSLKFQGIRKIFTHDSGVKKYSFLQVIPLS